MVERLEAQVHKMGDQPMRVLRSGQASGTLKDLCVADKQKVANLIKQVLKGGGSAPCSGGMLWKSSLAWWFFAKSPQWAG